MVDKPIAHVRDGVLSIAIWKNKREKKQGEKTIQYFTYDSTPSRMYIVKDANGNDVTKNSTSFREADALKNAELWREAYKKVRELRKIEQEEKLINQKTNSGQEPVQIDNVG